MDKLFGIRTSWLELDGSLDEKRETRIMAKLPLMTEIFRPTGRKIQESTFGSGKFGKTDPGYTSVYDTKGTTRGIDQIRADANALFDKFSPDEESFKRSVQEAASSVLGPDFMEVIDAKSGDGYTLNTLGELWNKQYTDHEALNEVFFWYDMAQQGQTYHLKYGPEDKSRTLDGQRRVREQYSPEYFTQLEAMGDEDWDTQAEAAGHIDPIGGGPEL